MVSKQIYETKERLYIKALCRNLFVTVLYSFFLHIWYINYFVKTAKQSTAEFMNQSSLCTFTLFWEVVAQKSKIHELYDGAL